jgi:hypothetical protein
MIMYVYYIKRNRTDGRSACLWNDFCPPPSTVVRVVHDSVSIKPSTYAQYMLRFRIEFLDDHYLCIDFDFLETLPLLEMFRALGNHSMTKYSTSLLKLGPYPVRLYGELSLGPPRIRCNRKIFTWRNTQPLASRTRTRYSVYLHVISRPLC